MTGFDEGLYRRLVDNSPEGVVLIDAQNPEQPVLYANHAFEALTGYTAAELVGRNLRLLQAHDRDQDGRHRLREALARGETCRVLLRNYRKDGALFWNEMMVLPLRDADGRVTHFAGHHRDAGERLRADPKVPKDSLSGAHQPTTLAIRDDRLTGLFTLCSRSISTRWIFTTPPSVAPRAIRPFAGWRMWSLVVCAARAM
jgi:PAS domain S-box-containing protein